MFGGVYFWSLDFRIMPSSESCFFETFDGELVKRQSDEVVLGKGMTSLMDSSPVNNMMILSNPRAIPR